MQMKKGNVLYGQSGGPTTVINSSALGVILESKRHCNIIDKVFIMKNGILGTINDNVIEIDNSNEIELGKLKHTSGAFFGSARYKLKDSQKNDEEYISILKTLKNHNIKYFFLNGGNDSMDTCNKISRYLNSVHYECSVIGIPKTIDNDLVGIDHCPGYGSSAKFIANLMIELDLDNSSYPNGKVVIVEIMGRNTGWLTASSKLASLVGHGPDLIYVPEVKFSQKKFILKVSDIYSKQKKVLIAVSEGIDLKTSCQTNESTEDPFGHKVLGGVGHSLASIISNKLNLETRVIQLGSAQRAVSRISSGIDTKEAELLGNEAVRQAIKGTTDKMVTMIRTSNIPYSTKIGLENLSEVANKEKKLPREMINKSGDNITSSFITYAMPLIQGECQNIFKNGLLNIYSKK